MPSFANQMKKWAAKTGQNVNDTVVGTNLEITRRIIQRTPVGNPDLWEGKAPAGYVGGRAKGNWFGTIGSPSTESTEGIRPESTALAQAMAAITLSAGSVYYLYNNLPYINRLEYEAWSSQAPAGMVRVTIAEFNRIVAQQLRKS